MTSKPTYLLIKYVDGAATERVLDNSYVAEKGLDRLFPPIPTEDNNVFELWLEGFSTTGESSNARFLGFGTARTFREACVRFAKEKELTTFDEKALTVWGCRMFDNEASARRSFG